MSTWTIERGEYFGRLPNRGAGPISVAETRKEMSAAATSSKLSVSRPLVLGIAGAGILLALAVALWAHYGSAVFFEMIAAGIAACF